MEIFYSNDIKNDQIILSAQESVHCVKVLRKRAGDEVKVSGGDGNLYHAIIEDANIKATVLKIKSIEANFGLHDYFLHMAVALPKKMDRFEWFLEKSTEIGIDEITPLVCAHSERKQMNAERQSKIMLSAAKQSLKGYIPELKPLTIFKNYIEETKNFYGLKMIAYCDHELVNSEGLKIKRISIVDALKKAKNEFDSRSMVLIGPEGDFSMEEIQMASDAGFIPISLGKSRLRIETAALMTVAAANLSKQG
ncbi:MAG: RsmE family RNA methyltransferase [Bacteroidales bacterium]